MSTKHQASPSYRKAPNHPHISSHLDISLSIHHPSTATAASDPTKPRLQQNRNPVAFGPASDTAIYFLPATNQLSSAHARAPTPVKATWKRALLTLLPLDADHVLDMAVDGVVGEDAGRAGLCAREADLRVDVERQGLAAGGPDGGAEGDGVGDGVVGGDRALKGGRRGDLARLAGEVVGGLLHAGGAGVQPDVAAELRREHAVLKARGVLQVQVELAVLARLGGGDAGADRGYVGVEDQGEAVGGSAWGRGAGGVDAYVCLSSEM